MKILFISKAADGYCLAHRMALEDNEVFFWVEEAKSKGTGKGLDNPKLVDSWNPYVKKADMIVFDMVGMGKIADTLRKAGKKVIGSGEIADKIELDRTFGMELVKKYTDADVSEFHEFNKVREGIKFLTKNEDLFVFKPLDNKFNKWTYVPRHTNEDLIDFLNNFAKLHGDNNEYIFQKKVEGIEISTEGWWNGKDWILPFNHTMEVKRFMDGNKGQQTGCQGSVVWIAKEDNEIVESILRPVEDILKKSSYVGCVDVNCIVDKENIWFLEFTSRFGYSAIQTLLALREGTITDFFCDIASQKSEELPLKTEEYALSVRISMPPYPHEFNMKNMKELNNIKAINYDMESDDDVESIWFSDVMFRPDGTPVLAGTDGVVCDVSGIGNTIKAAKKVVYKKIEEIVLPLDIQYRGDIGDGVQEKIEELTKMGWL